jgi:kynurenine formamidase
VKTSLLSQGLAVVILSSTFWAGPIRVLAREPSPEISLIDLQKILASKKFVDLTHDFAPGIPRWSGFPDEQRKTIYWYEKQPDMMGDEFFAEIFTHVGQWGTHVDPPAHFHKGLRTVDQIELKEMILPLVCIDVHEECAKTRTTRSRLNA